MKQIKKGKEVVLFGAGLMGIRALRYFIKNGIHVKYYCDNNKKLIGTKTNGVNIVSPMELKKEIEPIVIITSGLINEIKTQLEKIGIKNIFYFPILGYVTEKIEAVNDEKIIEKNKKKIDETHNLLSDNLSKKVFRNILNNRISWNDEYYDEIGTEEDIYFPNDILNLSSDETFVDAGAYSGDTISIFLNKTQHKFNKIYAFEPANDIYASLKREITKYKNSNILCFNQGLYNINKKLKFSNNDSANSKITSKGSDWINVVSLDSVCKNEGPITFIKMDVEGAEKKALKGASKLIRRYKPKLSICLYHRPADLWEIPLFIKSINPDYKIYFRNHSQYLTHTICYAGE